MFRKIFYFSILIASILIACEKIDNFSTYSKDYQYQAKFSTIIGNTLMTMERFGVDLPPLWNYHPDYLVDVDTIKLRTVVECNLTDSAAVKDKVAQIHLFIDVENEFPSELSADITLAGKALTPIANLDPVLPIKIAAAKVDSSVVKQKGVGVIEFIIKREDVNSWLGVKYVIVNVKIINKQKLPAKNYKYFSEYKVALEVRAQTDFDFNVKDLPNQ